MRFAVRFAVLAFLAPAAASAQGTPPPRPAPTPNPVTVGGYVRSFFFTRQNASSYTVTPAGARTYGINQASWNTALSIHAAYALDRRWTVAGTYLYADPLDGCGNPASHLSPASPCYNKKSFGPNGGTYPDDTLPGFRLSTLYEAFVQYKRHGITFKAGDQVITTPWANGSDSRLKPAAFQGVDLAGTLDPHWSAELAYMARFEDRVDSAFLGSTLLTATNVADAPGAAPNILASPYSAISTNGFTYARLSYRRGSLVTDASYYGFADIAGALWADGKYSWNVYAKPFLAVQAGFERSAGRAVTGKIDSQVVGVQAGITPWAGVDLSAAYTYMPQKSDTIALPAGTACNTPGASGFTTSKTANTIIGPLPYFLPAGGTPQCTSSGPLTTIYYGGWASPYTDGYATDPLFTTSISQGMADRRSPGQALKIGATFQTWNRRLRLIASRAFYRYGNADSGVAPTQETDLDGTWFLSSVPASGPYHGFSLRHRYAERTQAFTQPFGGLPLFQYNRTQLEYDF